MSEASEVWGEGTYERLAARLAPVQDQLVNLLGIARGERVLDLATGTGEVALRAARSGATVTGIDIAEPMLAKARERAQEERVNITFDHGDVEYLPYDDGCFDVVVSNFGLVLAPDHANVASELSPGWRMCTPCRRDGRPIQCVAPGPPWKKRLRGAPKRSWSRGTSPGTENRSSSERPPSC